MKEEPLHAWIEPELEARITALVLGEASDFEREELEHLIKERAELALLRKRTESLHGLLQEIATGESADDNDDWKLSDEKRAAVLMVIDGEAKKKPEESVVVKTATKPKARQRSFLRTFTQIAAVLFVMALITGLVMPINKGLVEYARTRKLKADAVRYSEKESKLLAALTEIVPNVPVERTAKTSTPNYRASSRSALLAIRGNLGRHTSTPEGKAKIESKLKDIILPSVEFQDTPLREALNFLQEKSIELDLVEQDPNKKGINLVLQATGMGVSPSTEGGGFGAGTNDVGDAGITLKLSDVPLVTALKYTVSLAQLKYKVEPHAVLILPLSTPDTDLYTNVYTVSPSFMSAASGGGDKGDPFADPFASPADEGGGPARRRTAKDVLLEAGVTFAPGASVLYNPETSQLIVRNTQDQMELVEAYKDSIKGKAEGLSFPDLNDQPSAPRPAFAISSFASSISIPEFDQTAEIDESLVSMSADTGASFGMAVKSPASAADPFGSGGGGGATTDPFASAGEGAEMTSADPFAPADLIANAGGGEPMVVTADAFAVPGHGGAKLSEKTPPEKSGLSRRTRETKTANRALRKSSSSSVVPMPGARESRFSDEASDKQITMGHGQVAPITITGQLAELEAEDSKRQNTRITGGVFGSEVAANGLVRSAGKKEASMAARRSVSPRSQISARSKMKLAAAPQKTAETLREGRSDGFAKTKAKQDADTFAVNTLAKSVPAAAPMPAIQEKLAASGDLAANRKTLDRVIRRELVGTDSAQVARKDVAMELAAVAKKKVRSKESRSELKTPLTPHEKTKLQEGNYIVKKVPISVASVNYTSAGSNITEEVRYRIDGDAMGDDPNTREVIVAPSGKVISGEEYNRRLQKNGKLNQINTDTAAAGFAWKTPNTGGQIDKDLGRYQPAQHEWQRYPNHPATTPLDLSLAPNVTARSGERSVVEQKREFIKPNNYDSPKIPKEQNNQVMKDIYRLTPKVVGGGSNKGTSKDPMEAIGNKAEEGFFIRGASFNDVFQFLAKSANLNYFHNPDLTDPKYVVQGALQESDPLRQMENLGLMYGITVSQKGNTVYAKSDGRLPQLPSGTTPLRVRNNTSKGSLFVVGDSNKTTNETPIRKAKINDVFQFLAKEAGLEYSHNALLAASNYTVSGRILDGDPLKQIADLGSNYGITLHQKGKTLYAMSKEQAAQPPAQKATLHAGSKNPKLNSSSIDSLVTATNAISGNNKDGLFIRNAQLNDVFTLLAKSAGLNYFHNPELTAERYKVTGHLQSGDPLSQMEELAYMYGITFLQNGGTVKALQAPEKKSPPPTGLNEKNAADEAFSTFSLHVSDVSFKLAQASLAKGEWPEASKVRIEEFVNAFDYGDPMPNQNEKVASQMEQSIHPFLQQRNLLRVSMRTAAAGRSAQTPLRLTFLLDNSGSMERSDRQQTVQRAFALLAQQLQPMDQVTLISFARQPRLLADKVSGSKAKQLVQLVSNIPSEGGTNLEAALKLAFEKAQEQQVDNAQNRIIMLTDGAANLGDADPENLSRMIETMRDAGIAFDAAGIGADGLNDEILEALTRKGDGRYYLLDSPEDADEGFARQIAGALRPAAKNVKVQIEFNPKRVGKYKLLGFEKHRLKKEDFRNDKVDAAEMAAAEAGVAVYQFEAKPDGEGDVGSVSVRFRDMSTGQMVENRWPIPYEADAPRIDQAAPSLRIASTAALFAAKLKGGPLAGSVDLKTLSNLISALPDRQRNSKRVQELQQMINVARSSNP